MNPWLLLFLAGLAEIGWATGMKYTHGFTRLGPTAVTLVLMVISFLLLAQAIKVLPLGTAYAIWTGIGALGVAALGILIFGESASPVRLAGIALIVTGIVVLKAGS
ncbi:quaternary ammonium compound efflux SMR transporter SugE [Paracoccus sp. p4-l81]|uniref:DMT family transporter n=1 Tax=unclassified Paracoccus (in: a-proteobacteria) TaxID=2688777 RepID=UPI0035B88F2A